MRPFQPNKLLRSNSMQTLNARENYWRNYFPGFQWWLLAFFLYRPSRRATIYSSLGIWTRPPISFRSIWLHSDSLEWNVRCILLRTCDDIDRHVFRHLLLLHRRLLPAIQTNTWWNQWECFNYAQPKLEKIQRNSKTAEHCCRAAHQNIWVSILPARAFCLFRTFMTSLNRRIFDNLSEHMSGAIFFQLICNVIYFAGAIFLTERVRFLLYLFLEPWAMLKTKTHHSFARHWVTRI